LKRIAELFAVEAQAREGDATARPALSAEIPTETTKHLLNDLTNLLHPSVESAGNHIANSKQRSAGLCASAYSPEWSSGVT